MGPPDQGPQAEWVNGKTVWGNAVVTENPSQGCHLEGFYPHFPKMAEDSGRSMKNLPRDQNKDQP